MKSATYFIAAAMLVGMVVELNTNPAAPVQPGASGPSQAGFALKRLPIRVGHPQPAGDPRIRLWDSTSGNWSGYAVPYEGQAKLDTFSDVYGSWTVTALVPGGKSAAYAATWVGLDGYNDGTVEQTGILQEWTGKTSQYYAWFEMYPGPMYEIVAPVAVGDVITAEVKYVGTTSVQKGRGRSQTEYVFAVTITDVTKNWTENVPPSYTTVTSAECASAEWIVEAPSSSSGVLPLADFGTTYFTDCWATGLAGSGGIDSYWTPDPLTMIEGNRAQTVESLPSTLVDTYNTAVPPVQ